MRVLPALCGSQHLAGKPWGEQTQLTLCCPRRHPFTPPKLSAYIDEAKTYAAEYTLQTLGIPVEGAEVPPAAPAFPGIGMVLQQKAPGMSFFLVAPCGCEGWSRFWSLRTDLAVVYVTCVSGIFSREFQTALGWKGP